MTVYAYIRVSTKNQKEEGVSIDSQIDAIERWFKYANYELKTTLNISKEEAQSGKYMKKRDKLTNLLEIINKDDILIVHSLSRLGRSIKDLINILEYLETKKAYLITLMDGIDQRYMNSKLLFHILSAVAENESHQTGERVKVAMKYLKENQRYYGRMPYGYVLSNGKCSDLIEDETQQLIIQLMSQLYKNGVNYNKIAKILNDNQIKPPHKSKKWYRTSIKIILTRTEIRLKGKDK